MSYVDYKEVKQLASIERVAHWLGLKLKSGRCQCPVNDGQNRELVITAAKGLAYCFGCKEGGDQIWLAAHVNQVDEKKAATEIMAHFHGHKPDQRGLPAEGLDYLQSEHDDVQALGLSQEKAEALGIGFAPRGTMVGHVLFPLRDQKGILLGYVGIPRCTKVKLPKVLL